LGPDTRLERRPTVLADIVDQDDSIMLVFEGRELTFPGHVREDLFAVFEINEPFTVTELPGLLDDAGLLVLARRLVREGFLRISEA
jgi:hypothetical protein